jgi:hypothetical protein
MLVPDVAEADIVEMALRRINFFIHIGVAVNLHGSTHRALEVVHKVSVLRNIGQDLSDRGGGAAARVHLHR